MEDVYNHATLPPPKIPRNSLKSLLLICTTKAAFKHIDGSIFTQKDGLAMGSPLSCTMANFYMAHIENEILDSNIRKPKIYSRYIDDIFVVVEDLDHLLQLQQLFKEKSVLDFTYETSIENKLPFLDVLLDNTRPDNYNTSVYTKPTKSQDCINFECDAPTRYKSGVIKTLINRAWKISNSPQAFESEIIRIKKLLINNDFPNVLCDKIIADFIRRKTSRPIAQPADHAQTADNNRADPAAADLNQSHNTSASGNIVSPAPPVVKIFYKNQFSKQYKSDETALHRILKRHVFQVNIKIDLCIYYKSKKTLNLIMKNNISQQNIPLKDRSHVVYEFICEKGECMSPNVKSSYVGLTTMSLKERLSAHRYHGSIFKHFRTIHGTSPQLDYLIQQTKIFYTERY